MAVAEPEKKDILLNSRNQAWDAGDMDGERRRRTKEDDGGETNAAEGCRRWRSVWGEDATIDRKE